MERLRRAPGVVCGLALLLVLAWGCGGGSGGGGSGEDATGQIVVSLGRAAASAALPAEITRVAATCTAPDLTAPIRGDVPLDGTPLALTVPVGPDRLLTLDAYSGPVHRMAGSATVRYVFSGVETPVTVTLVDLATLTVAPASATLAPGATQRFAAVVTHQANRSVTWSVAGVAGGNASVGTVSAGGVYTAPDAVPASPTVALRATSAADPTLWAEASITIATGVPDTSPPTVAASRPGGTYAPFTVTLSAADDTDPDPRIYYTTDDRPPSLQWTPYQEGIPLLGGTQTLRFFAVDAARNWSAVASETYTIEEPSVAVTVTPGAPRVLAGEAVQLSAAVTGSPSAAVTWSVIGAGSIDGTGLYTAPALVPSPATVTVRAASAADPTAFDEVTLTVVEPSGGGLRASYSTGPDLVEGPVLHGWNAACASVGYNEYQGACTPVASSPVDWAWGTGFAVTWTGWVHAPVAGSYQFRSNGWVDGTVYVEVGGVVVADFDTTGAGYSGTVTLAEGERAPVTLRFTPNGGSNNMRFFWVPPGGVVQAVPRAYLEPGRAIEPIRVSVAPLSALLAAGGSQAFSATVTGSTNPAVTWSVETGSCGAATGAIDASGLYTAGNPGTDCTETVRATSAADPTASGAATVTVSPSVATWARTFGGAASDYATVARSTPDGGTILGGRTASYGAGSDDAWVVKLASDGGVQWQGSYGFAGSDALSDVAPTADGGYLVAAGTRDAGAGFQDAWLLKLDATGGIQWQRTYGRSNSDYAASVQQTADGGYVVAGTTYTSSSGDTDAWVLRLDAAGDIVWQSTYGAPGTNMEWARSVRQTADGGYIVAGQTNSFGSVGANNLWVLKLDVGGAVAWEATYGPGVAYAVREVAGGGYVVAGDTFLRLDGDGNLVWARRYELAGTSGSLYAVEATADGGFVLAGQRYLADAGTYHGWLLRIDGAGEIVWQRLLGEGIGRDDFQSVLPTADGGYVAAGSQWTGDADRYQAWVVKLDASGGTAGGCGIVPGYAAAAAAPEVSPVASAATVGPASGVSVVDTFVVGAETGATLQARCGPLPAFSVSLNVDTATVGAGASLQFSASVTGTGDSRLTWTVDAGTCGAAAGSVSADGLYAAGSPAVDCQVTVRATSVADPTANASVGVTVRAAPPRSGWSRSYAGGSCNDVVPTADGGYVAVGTGGFQGAGWVRRLDRAGNVLWQRAYGGEEAVAIDAVRPSGDGGFVLAGALQTLPGPDSRGSEFWVARIDGQGLLLWESVFGAGPADSAVAVEVDGDGGYLVAGRIYDVDVGNSDFVVAKLDSAGSVVWQKRYPGPGDDYLFHLARVPGGGYVAVGGTYSFGAGDRDLWVLRLDAGGEILWQRTYGGAGGEAAESVAATPDGGFLVAGQTYVGSSYDWLVLKLDAAGTVTWQRTYGRVDREEFAARVSVAADGSYLLGGHSRPQGYSSDFDFALLGLDAAGNILWQRTYGGSGTEQLQSLSPTSDGGFVLGGYTRSFPVTGQNLSAWLLKVAGDGTLPEGCTVVRPASFVASDAALAVGETAVSPTDAGFSSFPGRSSSRTMVTEPLTQCSEPGVSVYPPSVRLAAGALLPFRAVEVGTGAESVTWYAGGVAGGYPDAGWIDALGLYEAPASVPASNPVTVEAVSDADPSARGSAWVEVVTSTPLWARTFGGPGDERGLTVAETGDGGSVVAGYMTSFGAGNEDAWVVKLDRNGGVQWQRAYGGLSHDRAQAVAQTGDGGYVVVGYTYSFGAGSTDLWVLRLASDGAMVWSKTYGGTSNESGQAVAVAPDGGYVVAGSTSSFGAGNGDGWVFKLDGAGAVVWQRVLGASATDRFEALRATQDGGYVAVGTKTIIPGGYASDNEDVWVVKLSADGQVAWQTTLGTTSQQLTPQYAYAVDPTADGGFILAGSDYFGSEQYTDFWVVKLDAAGAMTWQRTFGRTFYGAEEVARGVRQTQDGNFVLAGTSAATGSSFADVWLLKLNPAGEVLWQKAYGGAEGETALFALELAGDGTLLLAGNTHSFGPGGRDAWVLRLDADGEVDGECGIVTPLLYAAGTTAYSARVTAYTASDTAVSGVDADVIVTETTASSSAQCAAAGP